MTSMILSSFLDGFTGGSLFTPLNRPGAPTQVFADEGSTYPQEALVSSLLDGVTDVSSEPDRASFDSAVLARQATAGAPEPSLEGVNVKSPGFRVATTPFVKH